MDNPEQSLLKQEMELILKRKLLDLNGEQLPEQLEPKYKEMPDIKELLLGE
jgi:hypothetical protein